jgi:hypothetical protein
LKDQISIVPVCFKSLSNAFYGFKTVIKWPKVCALLIRVIKRYDFKPSSSQVFGYASTIVFGSNPPRPDDYIR